MLFNCGKAVIDLSLFVGQIGVRISSRGLWCEKPEFRNVGL